MAFHPHSRTVARSSVAALAALAVAAPSAVAKPSTGGLPEGDAPRVVSIEPGFDVDSAAVGAGVGACLASLIALGAVTLRGRRQVGPVR